MLNVDATSRRDERKRVATMQAKVNAANKAYDKWETDYNAAKLEEYYSGIGQNVTDEPDCYVINMCHPSAEQRMPTLMFYRPKFGIRPQNARSDDPDTNLEERCQLREDTLHTFTADPDIDFVAVSKLCLKESHYRFGVTEVGYDNEAAENPNAGKPVLDEDGAEMKKSGGDPLMHGEFVVKSESLWVRRIPAKTFRCSVNPHNDIKKCEWVGYYEWQYVEDLKKSKKYQNLDKLKSVGRFKQQYDAPASDPMDEDDRKKHQGMIKIWKMWDNRGRQKFVFPDNADYFLVDGEPFKFLPLALLKFYDLLDELYPIPVMYTWTSIQDEMNESRNMQKLHRKRFVRRFWAIEGKIRVEELEKLKGGPDGTIIWVPQAGLLGPIEDAPLDRAILANIPVTRDDFMYVSGVTGEQKGVAQSETATQAQIIDVNTRIRESEAREIVAKFLGQIGWIMLQTIEQSMALPIWIMKNVDPLAPNAMLEMARVAHNWQEIKVEDKFGALSYEVTVDVEALSPVTEDLRRQQFMTFLQLVTASPIALLLSLSPSLFKRVANLHGIRGDRELKEVAQALMITAVAMAGGGGKGGKPGDGASPGPAGEGGTGPGPTPGTPDIMQQLAAQIQIPSAGQR